jgi:two-component system cell cycle sensor histidine kinase/response regulator CckA
MSAQPPFDYEALLELSPDAVLVHDLNDELLYWNSQAERLYGWAADDLIGRPISGILYLDTNEREHAVGELLESGKWTGEVVQLNQQGVTQGILSQQRLIRDADGAPQAVVCYNRSLMGTTGDRDGSSNVHTVLSSLLLAGGMGQELNNALEPVQLAAGMLRRESEDAKSNGMLEMIEKSVGRAARLILDLTAFERGRGRGARVIDRASLESAIQELIRERVPAAVESHLELVADLWEFRGDLSELMWAVQELVQNALEAMPEGGALSIRVMNRVLDAPSGSVRGEEAEQGPYVCVVIGDTGIGIDPDVLDRVAEPLFTSKIPKRGHGFGLTRAQATVKGHRGFMTLASTPSVGTEVSLFLPADRTLSESEEPELSVPSRREETGQCILVVEDAPETRDLVQDTLEAQGYRVLTAADGSEALASFDRQAKEIDLVMMNLEMPQMDGAALCRALQKVQPDLPIIVSSGHTQPLQLQRIEALGVGPILAKPYSATQLLERVRTLLK